MNSSCLSILLSQNDIPADTGDTGIPDNDYDIDIMIMIMMIILIVVMIIIRIRRMVTITIIMILMVNIMIKIMSRLIMFQVRLATVQISME